MNETVFAAGLLALVGSIILTMVRALMRLGKERDWLRGYAMKLEEQIDHQAQVACGTAMGCGMEVARAIHRGDTWFAHWVSEAFPPKKRPKKRSRK